MDTFRNKFIGLSVDLKQYIDPNGNDNYNSVWTTSSISGGSIPVEFNGKYYLEIDITLSVDIGKNINFGNQTKYFISKEKGKYNADPAQNQAEELLPFRRQNNKTKNMESVQKTNTNNTENLAKTSSWGVDVDFYDTGGVIVKELKKSADNPLSEQNVVYYLTIVDPDYTIQDIPVVDNGVIKSPPLGEKVVLKTTFLYASDVLGT
jgi:hypothetical protein